MVSLICRIFRTVEKYLAFAPTDKVLRMDTSCRYMDFSPNRIHGIIHWLERNADASVVFAESHLSLLLDTPAQPLLEWIYVRAGQINLHVGGIEVRLEAGDVAWVNAHFGNQAPLAESAATYACISLDVSDFIEDAEWKRRPWAQILKGPDTAYTSQAYDDLARLHHAPDHPLRPYLLKAELVRLLGSLHESGAVRQGHAWPMELARALEFLHRNHTRYDLTIPEVARAAHISTSTLRRLCQLHIGLSPIVYLSRIRLHRAHDLLGRNATAVKAVALQVGFADPLYFSRLYSKAYGKTPKSTLKFAE